MTWTTLCSTHVVILLFGSKRIQTRPSSFLDTLSIPDQPHVADFFNADIMLFSESFEHCKQ